MGDVVVGVGADELVPAALPPAAAAALPVKQLNVDSVVKRCCATYMNKFSAIDGLLNAVQSKSLQLSICSICALDLGGRAAR